VRKSLKGSVFAVELDTDDYLKLRGGIQAAATFGNYLIVGTTQAGIYTRLPLQNRSGFAGKGTTESTHY